MKFISFRDIMLVDCSESLRNEIKYLHVRKTDRKKSAWQLCNKRNALKRLFDNVKLDLSFAS